MLRNLLLTFAKKGLYALLGALASVLIYAAQAPAPEGETEKLLWVLLVVPGLTGLAALIRRLVTWDPEKAMGGGKR